MNREQKKAQLAYQKKKLEYEKARLKRKKMLEKGTDFYFREREKEIAKLEEAIIESEDNASERQEQKRFFKLMRILVYVLVANTFLIFFAKNSRLPVVKDYLKKYYNVKSSYSEYDDVTLETSLEDFDLSGDLISFYHSWEPFGDEFFTRNVVYYQVKNLSEEEMFDMITALDSFILDQVFDDSFEEDESMEFLPLKISYVEEPNQEESDSFFEEEFDVSGYVNDYLEEVFGKPVKVVTETKSFVPFEEIGRPPYLEMIKIFQDTEYAIEEESTFENNKYTSYYFLLVTLMNTCLSILMKKHHKKKIQKLEEQLPVQNLQELKDKLRSLDGDLTMEERTKKYIKSGFNKKGV